MRRFPIGILIVVLAIVFIILGWRIYGPGEMGRFGPAIHAQKAPSELYARLLIRYEKPPIAEEEYDTSDIEGVSTFSYRIRGYDGHEIRVKAPSAKVYDVSFFFGRLVQDGIWQLDDKAPRPNANAHYTVYVKQVVDYQARRAYGDLYRSALLGGQERPVLLDRSFERGSERSRAPAEHANSRCPIRSDRQRFSRFRARRVPRERYESAGTDTRHEPLEPEAALDHLRDRDPGRARRRSFRSVPNLGEPSSQLFGKTIVSGPKNQRVIALTYDDGPNPPYTDELLSVLRDEHVHATFFVVGRAVAAYPEVVRREVADGNAIGNHTWSHGHLLLYGSDSLRRTLERTDRAIYAATGVHTRLMRPPFGARDWLVLGEVRKLGYTPVMWSVPLANDWEYPPARVIASRVLRYAATARSSIFTTATAASFAVLPAPGSASATAAPTSRRRA